MKKKIFISLLIGIMIGVSATAYAAYKYQAVDVGYTPKNSEFKVDNVDKAINELYKKTAKMSGATYVAPKEGETHKGIVYLDPTNLDNTCDENNSVSTTGRKTGCMKWYIFKEGEKNYSLILDHNTTDDQPWDGYVLYENSLVKPVVDKLVSESKWDSSLSPRLITLTEVNELFDKQDFDTTQYPWYYFDSKTQTQTANANNKSKYAWLFDNLVNCTTYGCNVAENPSLGYWTETYSYIVWYIRNDGRILGNYGHTPSPCGIRPVITVPKNVIK